MDIDTIFTEKPHFNIVKEYEKPVTIEDLTEVFAVIYRVDLPNYMLKGSEEDMLKDSMRYLFFTEFERAFKQYKFYGPRRAVISRMFTDNDELIELAKKSNFTIEVEEEEKPEEEEKVIEDKKEEQTDEV